MARELLWIPPTGPSLVLNDRQAGYRLLKGVRGLGAPEIAISTDPTPLLDGAVVTDVYAPPRTILLPMLVQATNEATYRARVLALLDALTFGSECLFQVGQPDGQVRRIRGYYAGGLEGWEDRDTGADIWHKFVLTVLCPDPWWFDPTPIAIGPFVHGGTAPTFFPFFPLVLASSEILGDVVINNPGDVLAWPTWTATPPGTSIEIDNVGTGEELHLSGSIPSGKSLVVVTEPGRADIALSDGTDWWDKLVDTPTLWALRKGDNHVTLSLTGSDVGSSVAGVFYPRYRSAW